MPPIPEAAPRKRRNTGMLVSLIALGVVVVGAAVGGFLLWHGMNAKLERERSDHALEQSQAEAQLSDLQDALDQSNENYDALYNDYYDLVQEYPSLQQQNENVSDLQAQYDALSDAYDGCPKITTNLPIWQSSTTAMPASPATTTTITTPTPARTGTVRPSTSSTRPMPKTSWDSSPARSAAEARERIIHGIEIFCRLVTIDADIQYEASKSLMPRYVQLLTWVCFGLSVVLLGIMVWQYVMTKNTMHLVLALLLVLVVGYALFNQLRGPRTALRRWQQNIQTKYGSNALHLHTDFYDLTLAQTLQENGEVLDRRLFHHHGAARDGASVPPALRPPAVVLCE